MATLVEEYCQTSAERAAELGFVGTARAFQNLERAFAQDRVKDPLGQAIREWFQVRRINPDRLD